jgi:starch synthase
VTKEDLKMFHIEIPARFLTQSMVSMSKLGLLYSDVITCVSKNMREDIVNGVVTFLYKDLLTQKGDNFIGVPNAVSDQMQPDQNVDLVKLTLEYKKGTSVMKFKKYVREYLAAQNIIDFGNSLPIVLFLGRFELDKGIEYIPFLASLAPKMNFNLLVLGYYTSYYSQAKNLLTPLKTMKNVRVVDKKEIQDTYGMLLRAASDFFFVPSKREGYGLVAAEAQSIGAIPIISNTGGLRDIVVNYGSSDDWTGFMFEMLLEDKRKSEKNIRAIMDQAMTYFKGMSEAAREKLVTRLLDTSPKWDDSVKQYIDAYQQAKQQIPTNIYPRESITSSDIRK